MYEHADKANKDIQKNGCHIIHREAEGDQPSFTYSIGIEKASQRPDIVVTGMEKDIAHFLVNEYNSRIIDGEVFEADQFYDDFLEEFQITFKTVDNKYYAKHFPQAQWLYEGDGFRMLHFIWPNLSGEWPWDKGIKKGYRRLMPRLYKED